MTRRSTWAIVATAVAVVVAVAIAEQAMGRVAICRCGYVKLWHGVVSSAENSQHLTDWYTPSHVIHGMAFYGLLWLVARRTPVGVRLLAAMFIEGSWEVFENTPFVSTLPRATIALDYYGDSLVNSVSDIVAMTWASAIARRLPLWASVAALPCSRCSSS